MVETFRYVWQQHPHWITWGVVLVYVLFIVLKGMSKAGKIGDTDDFLIAGRNVGWFLLFSTMGATVIGGGASIGAVGKTYDQGLLMLLVSTGWYVHLIFSGWFVAPKFREAKLYTVAGYFGHRFGEGPRLFALVLSLFFSVFIIAAQMAAFGWVLASLLPQLSNSLAASSGGLNAAILLGGLLVVAYSTAGGLLAVIHTDVYQFVILMLGFAVTLGLVVPDLYADWGQLTAAVPQDFFSPTGGKGWPFLITTFLAFLLGETFAPGYATRYCVGKNTKETRLGIAGVGFFLALTFPAVLFFIAAYARLRFPHLDPQMALPMVVRKINNPIVSGLMVGALLSAVMSSADSALNSATAIFVKDLFEHQLKRLDRGDGKNLRSARLCSIGLGSIAVLIAIVRPDIISLLLFTYHVWAPAVVVPVVFGIFSGARGSTVSRQIVSTMAASTLATFGYRFTPYTAVLDPAVFGVGLSAAILGVQRLPWKRPTRDAPLAF